MRTFPLVFSFVSKPSNSSNWNGMPSLTTSIIIIYSKNVQSGKEKCGELTMRKLSTSISYSDGVIYPTLFMLFADWVDRWFYRQMLQMYLNSKCPPGRLWYCKCIQIPNIHHRKDFNFINVQVLWLPKIVKHGKWGFPMGRRSSCTVCIWKYV